MDNVRDTVPIIAAMESPAFFEDAYPAKTAGKQEWRSGSHYVIDLNSLDDKGVTQSSLHCDVQANAKSMQADCVTKDSSGATAQTLHAETVDHLTYVDVSATAKNASGQVVENTSGRYQALTGGERFGRLTVSDSNGKVTDNVSLSVKDSGNSLNISGTKRSVVGGNDHIFKLEMHNAGSSMSILEVK